LIATLSELRVVFSSKPISDRGEPRFSNNESKRSSEKINVGKSKRAIKIIFFIV
jgi:hypothetical protein